MDKNSLFQKMNERAVKDSYKFTGYIRLRIDEKDIDDLEIIPTINQEFVILIGSTHKRARLVFENTGNLIRFVDKINTVINAVEIGKDMSNVS